MTIKARIRKMFRLMGYEVSRIQQDVGTGQLEDDVRRLLRGSPPVIFDVGGHLGQSVAKFKSLFPDAVIHSFEPSPTVFEQLKRAAATYSDIHLNNVGVGERRDQLIFQENSTSEMSSFLQLGKDGWGHLVKETSVDVIDLDNYCKEHSVSEISLLKTDTQGYDLSVLKGASQLLKNKQVGLVLIEVNFSELYVGAATFDEEFRFLTDRGFKLVNLYQFYYRQGLAGWADALFYLPLS